MKKVIKILSIISVLFLMISSTCYADVVMTPEDARSHGIQYTNNYSRKSNNTIRDESVLETTEEIFKYIIIGILIAIIIFCVVMFICKIVQEKKEKDKNDK